MNTKIVRFILILFSISFLSMGNIYSKIDSLFEYVSITTTNIEPTRLQYMNSLLSSKLTKSYQLVRKKVISLEDTILVNLPDGSKIETLFLNENGKLKMMTNNQFIFGYFILKGNKIRGYIQYYHMKYEIKPIYLDYHIIILTDDTYVIPEYCNFDSINKHVTIKKVIRDKVETIQDECSIRILVAYTDNARIARGGDQDINDDIELAIYLTNESYSNSNVQQRIELARSVFTNYSESGDTFVDLNRLILENDSFMDELHEIRDLYSADIVVLIADIDACGIATGILVDEENAFCIVGSGNYNNNPNLPCMTHYFSFGHELGHLMGCRHNPEHDPNNTPFPYGHGYCITAYNIRTIMSYNFGCQNRLQYWSNPAISFNGIPLGTINTHNNARVLNETEVTVREFRITPNFFTIPNHTVPGHNIANFLARSYLENSENFISESNSDVTFRAGDVIGLKNDFQAQAGSKFHAFIDNCGGSSSFKSSDIFSIINARASYYLAHNKPNPFSDVTEITYRLPKETRVQLIVYNSFGIPIARLVNDEIKQAGEHRAIFDGSNFPAGVYTYSLRANEFSDARQMILLK